jgi:uncharacterized damage-inducible protein DinB
VRTDGDTRIRTYLRDLLEWEAAHVTFDRALAGVPSPLRGVRPEGAEHSLWELLEHLRLAQLDILEFCRNGAYVEPSWPDDYWPATPAPPSARAWDRSIASYKRDRAALQALAADRAHDLLATIPHGTGQTYLRELLLVADHTAYHVGQVVIVRRMLGIWPPS